MATTRYLADDQPYQHPQKVLPARLCSSELMGGGSELIIEHAGSEYRLRITKQKKLILTK